MKKKKECIICKFWKWGGKKKKVGRLTLTKTANFGGGWGVGGWILEW